MSSLPSPIVWLGIAAPLLWSEEERSSVQDEVLRTLSQEDRQRLDSKKRELSRLEFMIGRWIAMRMASTFAVHSKSPGSESVRYSIRIDPSGQPFLSDDRGLQNVFLSISHSEGVVAVALSDQASIGIDIQSVANVTEKPQPIRSTDYSDKVCFSAEPNLKASNRRTTRRALSMDAYRLVLNDREMQTVQDEQKSSGSNESFIRRWTLKEAVVKSTGKAGLGRIASVDTLRLDHHAPLGPLPTLSTAFPHTQQSHSVSWSNLHFDSECFWTLTMEAFPNMILSLAIQKSNTLTEPPTSIALLT